MLNLETAYSLTSLRVVDGNFFLSGPHQRQTIPVCGVTGRAPLLFQAPLPLLTR